MRGADLDNFERTCSLYHVFDAMPGAQALFNPEACMADPLYDPDEILEPDPEVGPEPEVGE